MLNKEQLQQLLKRYNEIPAIIAELNAAIKMTESAAEKDYAYYGTSVKQNMSGMPFAPAGNVNNKVLSIVQNYEYDLGAERALLTRTKVTMEYVLGQLSLALDSLNPLEKLLIEQRYIHGNSHEWIQKNYMAVAGHMDIKAIEKRTKDGLSKMCRLMVLGSREYDSAILALRG